MRANVLHLHLLFSSSQNSNLDNILPDLNKIPPNPQDLLKSDFLNWTATLTNTDSPSYLPLHKRKWARLKDPKYRQNKRCHELLYTDHFGVMEKEGR